MAGKNLKKQKQVRVSDEESQGIKRLSKLLDVSESWIIRSALKQAYPEIFDKSNAGKLDGIIKIGKRVTQNN